MKSILQLFVVLICFIFCYQKVNAQTEYCEEDIVTSDFGLGTAFVDIICVTFSSSFDEACDPEVNFNQSIPDSWYNGITDNSNKWNKVSANDDITVTVQLAFSFFTGDDIPFHNQMVVNWRGESSVVSFETTLSSPVSEIWTAQFVINAGTAIIEGDLGTQLEIELRRATIPSQVSYMFGTWMFIEGSGIVSDPEWTTTAPSVPQIILRDPPGDGSYTEIIQGDETCHGHAITVSEDESNSEWGSVKLGVSGEVGLLYSAEVETYVEVSAGMEMGFVHTTVDESKLCVKVENTYSTSIDDPILEENGGDLYIGSAITYAYGVFTEQWLDESCTLQKETNLAFLPVSSNGFFIYPEAYITGTIIPDLEDALESFDPESEEYLLVADQLEVWEQNVQMNSDIKSEALALQVPSTMQFLAGSASTNSVTTTTSETSEYQYNMYIEETAAIEAGVYIAGSGGSLGAQIRSKTTKGSSSTSSNVHSTEISYTFNDDDSGTGNLDSDVFTVNIYNDPTFGTPIFELDESFSATSCPYEGGYLIDNPGIVFTENGSTDITINDIPAGQTYTFEVDICNESDFEREYYVKVPFESNLNGLQVSLAGTPINVTDGVTTDPIPPNTCLEGVDVTISQTEGSPELNYEDVRISIFSPCQPNFEPSMEEITFDAFFTEPLGLVNQSREDDRLSVFPNPNAGQFTVQVEALGEVYDLQIHDLMGRMIYQGQIAPSQEQLELSLDDISKGVYLVSVSNERTRMVQRFSIQ